DFHVTGVQTCALPICRGEGDGDLQRHQAAADAFEDALHAFTDGLEVAEGDAERGEAAPGDAGVAAEEVDVLPERGRDADGGVRRSEERREGRRVERGG